MTHARQNVELVSEPWGSPLDLVSLTSDRSFSSILAILIDPRMNGTKTKLSS